MACKITRQVPFSEFCGKLFFSGKRFLLPFSGLRRIGFFASETFNGEEGIFVYDAEKSSKESRFLIKNDPASPGFVACFTWPRVLDGIYLLFLATMFSLSELCPEMAVAVFSQL